MIYLLQHPGSQRPRDEDKTRVRGGIKPLLLFTHRQRRKKQLSQSGCAVPYNCVVPASNVTACSRDGTPWEPGADSLTCRCLRPTCASNLVVTWGGGGEWKGRGEEVGDDDNEKRLVRLLRGKLVSRIEPKSTQ